MFYFNLIKYYFAFKTRLKISDQKLPKMRNALREKANFAQKTTGTDYCEKPFNVTTRMPLVLIEFI